MPLQIANRAARRLILDRTRLSGAPTGRLDRDLLTGHLTGLGYVQLDSIQTVARAHHHILWSRNQHYREPVLARLHADRAVFEHWTHDAAAIPLAFYPHWHHQFDRMRERIARSAHWDKRLPDRSVIKTVRGRIEREGPLMVRDFEGKERPPGGWWAWSPEKAALEYLWFTGDLTTHGRQGFQKIYDLAERVIPAPLHTERSDRDQCVDWACREALARLGFGSAKDIQQFWDMLPLETVKGWIEANRTSLIAVEIEPSDGGRVLAGWALPDIEAHLDAAPEPTSRLRLLNPFDPLIRDRTRLERIFGFSYRIEVFVPKPKRVYGYYVYPMLEGARLVGRADIIADRKAGVLCVQGLWFEPGVRINPARLAKLDAELDRMRRFAGLEAITWTCPAPAVN